MPFLVKLFTGCSLLCLPLWAAAQLDTLLELPAVEVSASTIRSQSTGSRSRSWTKTDLQRSAHTNLGEWLGEEGGLFIKSYGNGSIATTSIRGGSAAHTSVLWNGLPIQSPMLGQLDFSLFPLGFIDRVQLSYGGNSAAWGSGAIGGVISLQNTIPSDSTFALGFRSTLGSFNFQDHQLSGHYRKGNWGVQTRMYFRAADNDFSYRLRPDLAAKTQTNAAIRQSGLLQSAYWTPRNKHHLSFHLWAQGSDREIPPTTVQNQSIASQADHFIRTAVHWKIVQEKTVWEARLGLFRETIDYQDEQIHLRALTGFWTAQGEVEGKWAWNDQRQLHFGLTQLWVTAEADAYGSTPQQQRTAPFLVLHQRWGRWRLQANLRQEMVDRKFQPLIPGLGVDGLLTPHLSLQAKISRNYRLPTLNDLYWQPGGNPDLLPESGWSQEAGLRWQEQVGAHHWAVGITAFNRNINNWILWSRPEGQSFWSSNNIAEVWSRGVEYRLQWQRQTEDWAIKLTAGFDQIRSTNEIAISNPKLEKGQQLVYVPKQQAFGQLHLNWRRWQWHYRHTYTGAVGSLNVGELSAYQLGSSGLDYQLVLQNWHTQLFFQAKNIWNENYRVIERQPMPGRYFQVGLQVNFKRGAGPRS